MEHHFELPVIHEGEELKFNGRLVTFGYSYNYNIVVDGKELVFEKDDEGRCRIIDNTGSSDKNLQAASLLQAIIASLEEI